MDWQGTFCTYICKDGHVLHVRIIVGNLTMTISSSGYYYTQPGYYKKMNGYYNNFWGVAR